MIQINVRFGAKKCVYSWNNRVKIVRNFFYGIVSKYLIFNCTMKLFVLNCCLGFLDELN